MLNQRRAGILLSYLYIILNSVIGIFFTPFILSKLGNAEYGLYQLVQSISSYLVIANCGTGTAMTKFVTQFRSTHEPKKEENYVFHNLFVATISMFTIGVVGYVMYCNIPVFYPNLSAQEIEKAKILFLLLVVNIMITTYTHAFSGYCIAHEKYVFTNGWSSMRIVLRVVSIVALLNLGFDSIAIVAVDLIINIFYLLLLILFSFFKLRMRIRFHNWDRHLLMSTFAFSFAILIQAVVNQINQNVDKVLLGRMMSTIEVTIYSVAMNVFLVFSQLPSVLRSVFLPRVTKMIYQNCSNDDLVSLSARVGRVQLIVVGAVVSGFALFGNNFMKCWVGSSLGDDYRTSWLIAMIIMIPGIVTMTNGVCATILDAKEKRIIGSVVLLLIAIINVVLTIILIKVYGIVGAPIATTIASVIGDILIMNCYYYFKLGIDIIKMYKLIFKGSLFSLLITTVSCLPLAIVLPTGWVYFALEFLTFVLIYSLSLWGIGLREYEKNEVKRYYHSVVGLFVRNTIEG